VSDDISRVNYISFGKTVGIYVYTNGEKELFTLESQLREQIAKEIEAHDDSSPYPCGCQNTYADIARGE
jgi:hypothetical protein